MSADPIKPRHIKGGRIDPKTLPRGPNGRALCRQCQQEVPEGKRSFCGQECVDRWQIRTGSKMRKHVFKRDRGICQICEIRCHKMKDEKAYRAANQIPAHRTKLWDVDHVIPVVEGGGDAGLSQLRTLCIPCHREETRKLAERRRDRKVAAG